MPKFEQEMGWEIDDLHDFIHIYVKPKRKCTPRGQQEIPRHSDVKKAAHDENYRLLASHKVEGKCYYCSLSCHPGLYRLSISRHSQRISLYAALIPSPRNRFDGQEVCNAA